MSQFDSATQPLIYEEPFTNWNELIATNPKHTPDQKPLNIIWCSTIFMMVAENWFAGRLDKIIYLTF